MRILIRGRAKPGQSAAIGERIVEIDTLRIGSGEDQELRLSDPRIGIAHAELTAASRGAFHLVAKTPAGVLIKGRARAKATLRKGSHFDCGRFRVHLLAGDHGVDLLLEQEEARSPRDDRQQRLAGLTSSVGGDLSGRRTASWMLFLAILLCVLALPAWLRYGVPQPPSNTVQVQSQIPSQDQAQTSLPGPSPIDLVHVSTATRATLPLWTTDRFWSPGPSSSAHAHFQNDCGKCHERPFVPVRNQACLACHEKTAQHVDDPKLLALPAFAQPTCESCHLEHQGAAGMAARQDARCSLCHADPRARFRDSRLEVAGDFSTRHPAFTPKLARYDAETRKFGWVEAPSNPSTLQPVRFLPAPGDLKSDTNLHYSHQTHLDPAGIKSPTGLKVLKCDGCHVPDGSGVGFRPISMQQHCAECHRLDFDPDDPSRVVPHGSESAVIDTIRDYYGRIALGGGIMRAGAPAIVQLRRRPGETLSADSAMAALSWADQRSKLVIDEVFDKRVCTYCHTVERAASPLPKTGEPSVVHNGNVLALAPMTFSPWRIAPVELATHRLAQSRPFPHSQHATEKCESCHNAAQSKVSEDVLMPPISHCRDCHGERGSHARIQSVCTDCHGFHLADHALMMDTNTQDASKRPRSARP